MNWKLLSLGLLLLTFAGLPALSQQQGKIIFHHAHSSSPFVMTGLTAIHVLIITDHDAIKAGFDTGIAQKEMEQQLRQSGIKVLNDAELQKVVGHPLLLLRVDVRKVDTEDGTLDGQPAYYCYANIVFKEDALLAPVTFPDGTRHQIMVAAAILWQKKVDGVVQPSKLADSLHTGAKMLMDAFIKDYVKANPKHKPSH